MEIDGVMEMRDHMDGYGRVVDEALFESGFNMRCPGAYDHFSTMAKVLNMIFSNRVYSKKNPKKVVKENLSLVYCVSKPEVMINLGYHVVKNLMDLCKGKNKISSLVHPRLITLFCAREKVKMSYIVPN